MVEGQKHSKLAMKISEGASKFRYIGVRHVQMTCMSFCMIALLMARSSMGVAILAMTDPNNKNTEVYDWDKKTQGLILSSFFWGYMSMQIPAGVFSKMFGGKTILLIALIVNAFLTALFPTLASLGGWRIVCVVRVCMGLAQACLYPASHTLLGRWLPANERTTYTGIVYSGSQLGYIIAMPLSGYLAETALGWKMIFYVISGVMFVTAAVWYWFSANSPDDHFMMGEEEKAYIERGLHSVGPPVQGPVPWKAILSTGALWAIVAAHIGASINYMLFFVDLPTYLEKALQISLKNSATLSALPYVGMCVGNIVSAALCEWIYNNGILSVVTCRKIFNTIGMCGSALGTIALAFLGPEHKVQAFIMLMFILTISGFSSAGFSVNHLDLSPQFAGLLLSITNFSATFCSAFTPLVTGYILNNNLSDISRWRIVFLLVSAIAIVSNLIYVIFGSADRQPWDSPDYKDRKKADPEEMRPLSKTAMKELEALRASIEAIE